MTSTQTPWDAALGTAGESPVVVALTCLHRQVDEVAGMPVFTLDAHAVGSALGSVHRLRAKLEALELSLVTQADAVAAGSGVGATSTATWWAVTTRQSRPVAHARLKLGAALAGPHQTLRAALAAGDVSVEQARVIVEALDALPTDLVDDHTVCRAREVLIGYAADHDPHALRLLGAHILDAVAPEVAEAHLARRLAKEEADAAARTMFTLHRDGHGTAHGRFTIPDLHADILTAALRALANPHHTHHQHTTATDSPADTPTGSPLAHRMGLAFTDYIESYPTDQLPHHGGTPATIVITLDYDTLLADLTEPGDQPQRGRDPGHRHPDHRPHRPPPRLPSRPHPRRVRHHLPTPRPRAPHPLPHPHPTHRPRATRPRLHHPRLRLPTRPVPRPPRHPLVPRRTHRPHPRPTPLPPPPRPHPRPHLHHAPPAQREGQLPPTRLANGRGRVCLGQGPVDGRPPCSSRSALTRLNGREPKKPRRADSGEGCADPTDGTVPSSG